MKKINFKNIRIRRVDPTELTDGILLVNLYATQAITLIIGIVIVFFQSQHLLELLKLPSKLSALGWAALFAGAVLLLDVAIGRSVPEELTDDGGINQMLFAKRPLWHIAVLSLVVAFCEELLFRGAVQHAFGPYWTSILFAAVHVRYLRHWLLTGMVFAISYGLGKLYMWTGSLWTPIAAHFLIDFVMGCIIRYRGDESGRQTDI